MAEASYAVRQPTGKQRSASQRRTKLIFDGITYFGLTLVGATVVIPFWWMLITSLKPADEVLAQVLRLYTTHPSLRSYQQLFVVSRFDLFYLNSVFVSCGIVLGQAVTSTLAGYAFARLEFPGRDKVFAGYLVTMMVPFAVRLIPLFIIMRQLNWVDTYYALIVPHLCSPYNTFFFRQYYKTIPADLSDAAKLDGCGAWGIYRYVMLPLSRNILSAMGILTFLSSWKDFLWPLIVTSSRELMVIAVALAQLMDELVMDWGLLMAAASLAMIPGLIVFIAAQEQFISSITLTGITG
jgi:multiple sugar transport system permease protein